MNIFVNRILGFGLLSAFAATGALQAAEQGKFHLPMTVTWANVVLPAGDYTVSLPEVGLAHREFVVESQGKRSFVPVMSTYDGLSASANPEKSCLILRNINGAYFVESYRSAQREKEFNFKVPKSGVKLQYGKREAVKLDVAGE
jgi:hypothetical protein